MHTVTLVVPAPPPPSLNRYARMHWTKRRALRYEWSDLVWAAVLAAGRPAFHRAAVTVRLYYATQRRRDHDHDNAIPKLLLDALVDCGVLPDDNPACITAQPVEMYVDRVRPRVEIEVTGET